MLKEPRYFFFILIIVLNGCKTDTLGDKVVQRKPPNILFAISDDQSYPHASAYGSKMVLTPAFDRVASEGVLFTNAFAASPGCAPSRAAILTGKNPWELEEAGTHGSSFPEHLKVYPDILEEAGYHVGYTSKGWAPGDWQVSGRKRNPAGDHYNEHQLEPPFNGISTHDYAANFKSFLSKRSKDKPFCFWFGSVEPHRVYEKGSGVKSGKNIADAEVPDFLPDTEEIRSDLLDYAVEIEWFDKQLGLMIAHLEEIGELDNTIIIVTSDNGMPFPRAKANLYEHGVHVPLAIRWGNAIKGGRVLDNLVSLIDLAPTYLDIIDKDYAWMSGKSLLPLLLQKQDEPNSPHRTEVFASRERHSSSRWQNLGYSQRGIRTEKFLYIRNFTPERWPAGAPQQLFPNDSLGPMHGGYFDIDACPTQDFLVQNYEDSEIGKFLELAVDKRPEEELFDIVNDPFCLNNLAGNPDYQTELEELRYKMGGYLMKTGDPRVLGKGDIFETYPRLRGQIRNFPVPDWAQSESDKLYSNGKK